MNYETFERLWKEPFVPPDHPSPKCPHCNSVDFLDWYAVKIHVKTCQYGPHTRKRRTISLRCTFCGFNEAKDFAELSVHVRTQCLGFTPKTTTRGDEKMNVGKHVNDSGDGYLPLLDAKLFKKLQKKGAVSAKMIACREVKSPKFEGLAMDFKGTTQKFSFLARFDRWDITALAKQLKSDETDDWIGEIVRFVAKKSSKGQIFVNVELPKRKKGKK